MPQLVHNTFWVTSFFFQYEQIFLVFTNVPISWKGKEINEQNIKAKQKAAQNESVHANEHMW